MGQGMDTDNKKRSILGGEPYLWHEHSVNPDRGGAKQINLLQIIQSRYHLPDVVELPSNLIHALLLFRRYENEAADLNAYYRTQEERLDRSLRELLTKTSTEPPSRYIDRNFFRSQLQEYSFYTCLQLFYLHRHSLSAELNEVLWAFLARLYLQVGVKTKVSNPETGQVVEVGYAEFLAFDQLRDLLIQGASVENILTRLMKLIPSADQLLNRFSTQDLHQALAKLADQLADNSHSSLSPQKHFSQLSKVFKKLAAAFRDRKRVSRTQEFLSVKHYAKSSLAAETGDGDEVSIEQIDSLDDEESERSPVSLIDLRLSAFSSEKTLSALEKARRYSAFKRSVVHAIELQNKPVGAKPDALTPAEFRQFVLAQRFHELDLTLLDIDSMASRGQLLAEMRFRLLFWLTALTGRTADTLLNVRLVNELSKECQEGRDLPAGLSYNKHSNTVVLKELVARVDSLRLDEIVALKARNMPVTGCWQIQFPPAIEQLLMALIRRPGSKANQQIRLSDFLSTSPDAYSKWLNGNICHFKKTSSIPVSSVSIRKAFDALLRVTLPEVIHRALNGEVCVQSYYVNYSIPLAEDSVARAMRDFFRLTTEVTDSRFSAELNAFAKGIEPKEIKNINSHRSLDQPKKNMGSHAVIHSLSRNIELLGERLLHDLRSFRKSKSKSLSADHRLQLISDLSESLSSYVFVRLGLQQALRPVNNALCAEDQFCPERLFGFCFDKDSHRNGRARLLFFTPGSAALLQAAYLLIDKLVTTSERFGVKPLDKHTVKALIILDPRSKAWQPFLRTEQQKALRSLLTLGLDSELSAEGSRKLPGVLRHTAASQLLALTAQNELSRYFSQDSINTQLNHFLRGAYPVSQYQTASLQQIVDQQTAFIDGLSRCTDGLAQPLFTEVNLFDLDQSLVREMELLT